MDPVEHFGKLYEEHYDVVFDIVQQWGVSKVDAEDLTHDTFLKALKEYDPARDLLPLLIRIAINEACSFHRRQRTARKHTEDVRGDQVADRQRTAEQGMRLAQQWRFLWDRIDELDPEERSIFVMVEMHHVLQREVAAKLQIPLTQVESKLRDARRKLRDAIRRAHARGELPAIMPLLGEGWKAFERFIQRLRESSHRAWRVLRAGTIAGLASLLPGGPASLAAHAVEAPASASPVMPSASGQGEVPPALSEAETAASTCGAASLSYETGEPVSETEPASSERPLQPPAPAIRHAAPRAAIAAATDQADREQLLIDGARNALYAGNIDLALAELERHKRLYPDGYLAHFREELLGQIYAITGKGSPDNRPPEAAP